MFVGTNLDTWKNTAPPSQFLLLQNKSFLKSSIRITPTNLIALVIQPHYSNLTRSGNRLLGPTERSKKLSNESPKSEKSSVVFSNSIRYEYNCINITIHISQPHKRRSSPKGERSESGWRWEEGVAKRSLAVVKGQ